MDGSPEGTGADLTMVVRRWCSLCDAMREALAPLVRQGALRVAEVDLDAHPDWEPLYGARVPVLVVGTPPGGEVVAVNEAVSARPEVVNEDPYGEGWLVRVRLSDPADLDELMDRDAYTAYLAGL